MTIKRYTSLEVTESQPSMKKFVSYFEQKKGQLRINFRFHRSLKAYRKNVSLYSAFAFFQLIINLFENSSAALTASVKVD